VVDDSRSIRNFLGRFLKDSYPLSFAKDGDEGLETYASTRPDVVILDMNMPGRNGLEVIEAIRGGLGDQDVYIIFLTGESASDLKTEALNAGANDFLTKPVEHEELLARLGVARRHIRLNRSLRSAYDTIAREMDLVVSLQGKLLPHQSPRFPGVRIGSLYQPSGRASGDYFDYFPVGPVRPGGPGEPDGNPGPGGIGGKVLRVVIADVSGHGARAAFLMAIVRTLFRITESRYQDLVSTMALVNSHLCQIIAKEADFVTIFAADIDFANRRIEYVNAGHPPGLLLVGNGEVAPLPATAPLMGFFSVEFTSRSLDLGETARLLLYTDGLYEWEAEEDGELLGLERFAELASRLVAQGGEILDVLLDEMAQLGARPPKFRDDLTALWIEWNNAAV
jgi:sigma-B regulation protein RsbU (phosphoserine phosphatase)